MKQHDSFWSAWNERVSALRNVPPVLKIVWQSGPTVVALGLVCRVLVSLLPLAMLALTKLIVDYIVHAVGLHQAVPRQFWWLVAAEFGLAVLTSLLGRVVDYFDAVLADKYSQHVSVQVMEHAANLDLLAYENPVFYDRLERARVQATDRLAMIQAIGRLVQQVVTSVSLSLYVVSFSPWLLLLLVAGLIPAFAGESHFAFLGYAKNFRQTPIRRQLDYLRLLGGSKEAAKELKLFGLKSFLTRRFARLWQMIDEENRELLRRRLVAGVFFSALGTLGYYSAYVFVIWRTLTGAISIGAMTALTGAILQVSGNIQQLFSTLSGIADQRCSSLISWPSSKCSRRYGPSRTH